MQHNYSKYRSLNIKIFLYLLRISRKKKFSKHVRCVILYVKKSYWYLINWPMIKQLKKSSKNKNFPFWYSLKFFFDIVYRLELAHEKLLSIIIIFFFSIFIKIFLEFRIKQQLITIKPVTTNQIIKITTLSISWQFSSPNDGIQVFCHLIFYDNIEIIPNNFFTFVMRKVLQSKIFLFVLSFFFGVLHVFIVQKCSSSPDRRYNSQFRWLEVSLCILFQSKTSWKIWKSIFWSELDKALDMGWDQSPQCNIAANSHIPPLRRTS